MKKLIVISTSLLLILSSVVTTPSKTLAALNNSNVISDASMRYSNSMNATEINNFFKSNGSWLADYVIPSSVSVPYPTASGLAYIDARQYNDVTGEELSGKTVAQLIADESISHNINPEVIIATLQKESSAITRSAPSSSTTRAWPMFYMYNESMGDCLNYGTSCNDSLFQSNALNFGGIGQQIAYSTAWFNKHMSDSFSTPITIDGQTFTCANAATRVLYLYTPHIQTSFYNIYHGWFVAQTNLNVSPGGSVTASASGQTRICSGENCKLQFPEGATITFRVNGDPNVPAKFTGWTGCAQSDTTCTAVMNDGLIVSANFIQSLAQVPVFTTPKNNWDSSKSKFLTAGDFNGDGKQDLASMYDYGQNNMSLFVFLGDGAGNYGSYQPWYYSGVNNWSTAQTKELVSGDFNKDGRDDLAVMYDYGHDNMSLFVFPSSGSSFGGFGSWYNSGWNNWSTDRTKKLVSGDFNKDGLEDLAVMYDYGQDNMSLFIFPNNGTGFNNFWSWYNSGKYNWSTDRTKKLVSGDFNKDGLEDLAVMYDYGQDNMSLFIFPNAGNSFGGYGSWYNSGKNNWSTTMTKDVVSGDFNKDGLEDLAVMYDYGQDNMSLFIFPNAGNSFGGYGSWYNSGKNNWSTTMTKDVVSGDFNKDGLEDLAMMYDYGSANMSLFVFASTGGGFSYAQQWYNSGVNNWNTVQTSKILTVDSNGDGQKEILSMYNYGSGTMSLILFKPTGEVFSKVLQ